MSKLPSIGSPNESLSPKKSMFESTIIEAEVEHETPFDTTLNELSLIDFPHPEENSSMKNRITTLESNNEKQINFNKLTLETFNNLNANVHNLEDHIRLLLGKLQESYDEKLNNLKKEFDHRFELQLNENKRLQNHIASLKSDNNLIKTKLVSFFIFIFIIRNCFSQIF